MSKEQQSARRRAGDATGHLGRLIGDTVLVLLTEADGQGIEGRTIHFYVRGKEMGSDRTDANGEFLTNAGFEVSHKYRPSHAEVTRGPRAGTPAASTAHARGVGTGAVRQLPARRALGGQGTQTTWHRKGERWTTPDSRPRCSRGGGF
jgi:hypothetical protein